MFFVLKFLLSFCGSTGGHIDMYDCMIHVYSFSLFPLQYYIEIDLII